MKNRFYIIISVFFTVLVLVSCKIFKEPEFRSIENTRISKFGFKESTVLLDIRYFNPNNSKIQLKKAEGEAWVEGNYLGKFNLDTLIHIQPVSDFMLPVTLVMDMSRIISNSAVAYLKDSVMVKIEGKARVGKAGFFINYPIRYEGKQNLSALLNQ